MSQALNYFEQLKNESPGIFYRCSPSDGWAIIQISNNIVKFGFSKLDIINKKKTFKDLMHPDDYLRVEGELTTILKNKQDIAHFEWRILSPDGEVYWVKEKTIIERDVWGRVKSFHGLIVDITEDILKSRELKIVTDISNQYQEMMDQVAIVASTDIRGRITYVNDQFCKVSGYSREELIGQTHSIVNSGIHDKSFFKNMWRTINRGGIWKGRVANRSKNGEVYWLDTAIVPIMDSGKVSHYMAIRFDVSDQKRLEKSLEEERKFNELSSHLATIGEMSTGIMHEINNPLSIIGFHVSYLLKKIERKEINKEMLIHGLTKMKLGVERAGKVTSSLRNLSQFNFNEEALDVDLNEVVRESIDLCVYKLKKSGVEVEVEDYTESAFINTKYSPLSQILINLLCNAVDAIEPLKEKWIKVILEEDYNSIDICIQDSGNGVPKEIAEKVMKAFYTTKVKGKGTGVGLSLSKYLSEQIGAELYIDQERSNTTFVLSFQKR